MSVTVVSSRFGQAKRYDTTVTLSELSLVVPGLAVNKRLERFEGVR